MPQEKLDVSQPMMARALAWLLALAGIGAIIVAGGEAADSVAGLSGWYAPSTVAGAAASAGVLILVGGLMFAVIRWLVPSARREHVRVVGQIFLVAGAAIAAFILMLVGGGAEIDASGAAAAFAVFALPLLVGGGLLLLIARRPRK